MQITQILQDIGLSPKESAIYIALLKLGTAKAAHIADAASLTTTTDKVVYEVSDFEAKELSENFVLTTFKTKRTINNADIVVSLRSSLWKKTGGNWQMFFHQGTPTK